MTKLESTKQINRIKASAIKAGGMEKFKGAILEACKKHFEEFGVDLTPPQLKTPINSMESEALEQIKPRVKELVELGMPYEQACNKAIQEKILTFKMLLKEDLTNTSYSTNILGIHKV